MENHRRIDSTFATFEARNGNDSAVTMTAICHCLRRMGNLTLALLAAAGLSAAAETADAGGVATGSIQIILTNVVGTSPPVYDYALISFTFRTSPIVGTPSCNLYNGFALRLDTEQGRAMYQSLISARTGFVTIYGTGDCLWFDRETVQAIMF